MWRERSCKEVSVYMASDLGCGLILTHLKITSTRAHRVNATSMLSRGKEL